MTPTKPYSAPAPTHTKPAGPTAVGETGAPTTLALSRGGPGDRNPRPLPHHPPPTPRTQTHGRRLQRQSRLVGRPHLPTRTRPHPCPTTRPRDRRVLAPLPHPHRMFGRPPQRPRASWGRRRLRRPIVFRHPTTCSAQMPLRRAPTPWSHRTTHLLHPRLRGPTPRTQPQPPRTRHTPNHHLQLRHPDHHPKSPPKILLQYLPSTRPISREPQLGATRTPPLPPTRLHHPTITHATSRELPLVLRKMPPRRHPTTRPK